MGTPYAFLSTYFKHVNFLLWIESDEWKKKKREKWEQSDEEDFILYHICSQITHLRETCIPLMAYYTLIGQVVRRHLSSFLEANGVLSDFLTKFTSPQLQGMHQYTPFDQNIKCLIFFSKTKLKNFNYQYIFKILCVYVVFESTPVFQVIRCFNFG